MDAPIKTLPHGGGRRRDTEDAWGFGLYASAFFSRVHAVQFEGRFYTGVSRRGYSTISICWTAAIHTWWRVGDGAKGGQCVHGDRA